MWRAARVRLGEFGFPLLTLPGPIAYRRDALENKLKQALKRNTKSVGTVFAALNWERFAKPDSMTTPGQFAYRVVVRGVKPEQPVDQVVEALSRLSKTPPAALRLLLDGRKVVFKRTSDVQRAAAYKRTLDMIGCVCSIEPEAPPLADPDAPAFTVNFRTAEIMPAHGRGREFQFAKRPPIRELLVTYLHANRVTFGIALVLALYLGYKFLPGFT